MQGIVFDLDETLVDRRAAVEKFAHALWLEYFCDSYEVVYQLSPQLSPQPSPQPRPHPLSQTEFLNDVVAKDQNGYLARPVFFAAMFQSYSKHVPSQKVIEDLFYDIVWLTPIVVEGGRTLCCAFRKTVCQSVSSQMAARRLKKQR
ncbi:MAG: hypothetical protein ACI9W1_000683 [Candidatus Azotimanducaceae bacterium]|jgi:hypothetical protein